MKTFEEDLIYYKDNGINLFYNSEGNDQAYKLFIRHIGYAVSLGYGKIKNGILFLEKDIFIVNFEEKIINLYLKEEYIHIIPLKILE